MGMPSGRYVDLFLIVPLTALVALFLLCRETAGAWKKAWMACAWLWCGLQLLGFSIHVLYRTIPFIGNQTGEWFEPAKLVTFRNAARDPKLPMLLTGDPLYDYNMDVEHHYYTEDEIRAFVHGTKPFPAMTLPMITGFPLLPAQGNYVPGGYFSAYVPRPGQNYVGSFDPNNRRTPKSYTSPPFTPTAPYILMDLIVDKKARFANYHFPNLDLALVDRTAGGRRLELLPRLATTFPFLFRDWESIYAPVTPGHTYVLESTATDGTPGDWLAFAEPTESGYLTPFTIGVTQSGKLICLVALGLLAFCAGLHRGYFGMLGGRDETTDSLPRQAHRRAPN
jgi:hypothetical protein